MAAFFIPFTFPCIASVQLTTIKNTQNYIYNYIKFYYNLQKALNMLKLYYSKNII